MALFGSKKKKEVKNTEGTPAASRAEGTAAPRNLTQVLRHARITEKASMQQAAGVYTFDISAGASKRDILQAVKKLYNVTPRKVAVVTVPSKNVRSARTGKSGVKSGGRKAYVYLKKGDSITF
ncbi:50S ribosomal protein L23 [Candidatus Kaiserbacteria bacterium]|nr:50S ribosomal protein L23 [Candidatus Kaiserbacteria bacterium]